MNKARRQAGSSLKNTTVVVDSGEAVPAVLVSAPLSTLILSRNRKGAQPPENVG